jgi:sugar/nucleoside kinase (ribokinase family)
VGLKASVYDVLIPGRPSIDVMFGGLPSWPRLGEDVFATTFGVCAGTGFNTPAAANRLGLRVGHIATIGNDLWSRMVREEFDAEGLPTTFLRVLDRPIPFISVAMNHDDDRGFVSFDAGTKRDEEDRLHHVLEVVSSVPARHLHAYVGEASLGISERAHARGMTVSLDAWGGHTWAAVIPIADLLVHTDVVFANESEACAMTGVRDVRVALERLADHCPCVVIKRGGRGAIAMAGGAVSEVTARPVEVVDTTGAGDCFNAGFLYGWLADLPLRDSLTLGNICGGRAASTFGGYRGCPRAAELASLAAEQGIVLA